MMKYLKRYNKFFEDGEGGGVATVNASNTAGMGAVVSAQPGAFAGTTGTTGSGDVGFVLGYNPKKKRKVKHQFSLALNTCSMLSPNQ